VRSFMPFLGFIWGLAWALIIEYVPLGQFLVRRRTWITVVIGVGGDMAIAWFALDFAAWSQMALIVGLSSIPVVMRSLLLESNGASERLPNKVIWGIEDVLARCLRAGRALDETIERARVLNDSPLMSSLLALQGELFSIRARAADARRGTYDYGMDGQQLRPG